MKDENVLELMIERGVIPEHGTFDVKLSMVDAFYDTYREVYPAKNPNQRMRNNDVKYAKRLAGLSLMKLNVARADKLEYKEVKNRVHDPKCGIVYLVSNPAFPGYYKIGMTCDLDARLAQYQTGDPHRAYKVEHQKFVEDRRTEEKRYLEHMKTDIAKGEWVKHERVKELFDIPV